MKLIWFALIPAVLQANWLPLNNTVDFAAETALLLTDGTVLVHEYCSPNWHKLTPDSSGSYLNGTWKKVAPSPYGPLFFASAVLGDGRVVIVGGEYTSADSCSQVESNQGAVYNPATDSWTSLSAPWFTVGDAAGLVLPTGEFLVTSQGSDEPQLGKLDPVSLTWTVLTGRNKQGTTDEEGWVLLPDGSILTVDMDDAGMSERYIPWLDSWVSAGSTIANLVAAQEVGPAVLRPDGTVFATGASGHTAVFNIASGAWVAGPDFPVQGGGQNSVADGPAVLLPNGNVLVGASPVTADNTGQLGSSAPTRYFEFDGTRLNPVTSPPGAQYDGSFQGHMLMLPTGQVLFTDGSSDIELYTPAGTPNSAWAPTIKTAPATVVTGATYTITGTQFNGLSQASNYGDDVQQATNYPLVRITNKATGHVFYCRTHNHSSMGVATGATLVSTEFDVPTIETGASILEVVVNGIASAPSSLTVAIAPVASLAIVATHTGNFRQGHQSAPYTITIQNTGAAASSGTVTLTVTLPTGLTATSISGSNWTCTQPSGPCTRSDVLAPGNTYPAIILKVNVNPDAPLTVTTTVTVQSGLAAAPFSSTWNDLTNVLRPDVVNAASLAPVSVAPDEFLLITGDDFAATAVIAESATPPLTLGGVSVTVADGQGQRLEAPLVYVSPTELYLIVPSTAKSGPGSLMIQGSSNTGFQVPITIANTAPGIFTAMSDGVGPPAGVAMLSRRDGSQAVQYLSTCGISFGVCSSNPIVWSPDVQDAHLTLFGTGLRHEKTLTATVSGQPVDVTYLPGSQYSELDQVTVHLPAALGTAGAASIQITADSGMSNSVNLTIVQGRLSPQACQQETSLRSGNVPNFSSITFTNDTQSVRKIYWLDESGQREIVDALRPGNSETLPAYVNDVWVVTDPSDKCTDIFTTSEAVSVGLMTH
jgi:uncharacterized protein (TIGR03437 family)